MFEMKDSGIEWLGEIPSHWKVGRLKNLFTLQRGYDLPAEKFIDGDFPIYGSSGLMGYHNQKTSTAPNVVIGRSGSTGKLHYIEKDFWAHNTGIFISDKKGNCCKYIFYLLNILDMEELSTKTAVPTLDRKKIQNYKLPYTTDLAEQKKIANYLDAKCAAIDSALDAAKKLVEKFREYKKSLITETVTKGLNPSAEFVDSNIEWLGEIPSHWKIIKLKFLAIQKNSILSDGDWIESKDLSVDGINYFTTGNVGDGFFKENDFNYVSNETFDTLNCTAIKGGDFIFSRLNLPMGRACIIPDKYIKSVIAVDNVLFRPDDYVEKNFILYVTMCPHYQEHNALVARGTTMQRMSHSQLKNLKIPIPPLAEQKKIADFLDKKCAAIDENISKREKLIEKLTEYKKSLIYEVVTGKLEV